MLELINRARMDPAGEAKRFGIKLNEGVHNGDKISAGAKQVLAGNNDLLQAANAHSDWMLDHDIFAHEETGGGTGTQPEDRMVAAGYGPLNGFTSGENISFRGSTNAIDLTKEIIRQHRDLFIDKGVDGRGHRLNILIEAFQEVGIGQEEGKFKSGGTNFNASMVTQDFGKIGNNVFVTGVVYDDTKNDNFFTVGEETAGVTVTGSGGPSDTTGAGGGYALLFNAGGPATVTFGGAVTVGFTIGASNIKLDLVNGTEVWTNADIILASPNVTELHALGIETVDLSGSSNGEKIFGNKAANILQGNGGTDTLDGGGGKDELHGGADADIFVFDDRDTGKTNARADTIVDFIQGADTIDLDPWDADSKKKNDQDFEFIGTQKFHKDAGELRFMQDGGDTFIQGDTNGDGKADFVIRLNGAVNLVSTDFDL